MQKITLNIPQDDKYKGQNGKLLIIGGSDLFHGASLWSAQIAAHIVDMVFYAGTEKNNLMAKNVFHDGIVIERSKMSDYLNEAEVILLGPGMMRGERRKNKLSELLMQEKSLSENEWQNDTYLIVNYLLANYPKKKFVLDAGALQMLEIEYLQTQHILTPHQGELKLLRDLLINDDASMKFERTTVVSKNIIDEVWQKGELKNEIRGGNAGLTKGGSGDALAGLIAALYCFNEAEVAAAVASMTVKKSAEILYQDFGPFFTTSQLVQQLPKTLWLLIMQQKIELVKHV